VLQVVSHELLRELAQDEDHLEALNQLGMGSVAVLPIPVAGRVAAALAVANAAGRYITDADLRFLEDVTTRVGSAAALADRAGRGESAPA
jgi:GAF domain-containing protein